MDFLLGLALNIFLGLFVDIVGHVHGHWISRKYGYLKFDLIVRALVFLRQFVQYLTFETNSIATIISANAIFFLLVEVKLNKVR